MPLLGGSCEVEEVKGGLLSSAFSVVVLPL